MNLKGQKMLLTVLIYIFSMHGFVYADLVYDDAESAQEEAVVYSEDLPIQPTSQQRQSQVVRRQANQNVQPEGTAPSQVIVNQTASPYVAQNQDQDQAQNQRADLRSEPVIGAKAGMVRRERVREELQNEDRLQTRLEELRLQDEAKRVDKMLGGNKGDTENTQQQPQVQYVPVEVVKVKPKYEQEDEIYSTKSSVAPAPSVESSSGTLSDSMFYIQPKGGIANFTGNKWYDIDPRFSLGVNLGFIIAEHYGIELGYAYSQFDVKMQQNWGFQGAFNNYLSGQMGPYGQYQQSYTNLVMKQNVIDANFKAFLTPKSYRFRPYVGAGLGWGKSYINYDDNTIKWIRQVYGQATKDYELSQYLGVLSAGFDIQLNESIAVGLGGKYYQVLSSNENSPIYNYGFYNPNYGGYYNPPPGSLGSFDESEKGLVSGSLKDNSFYSLSLGLTFSF